MRFLESNPMQAALYVMILLDACVVIAEILLDLHAMRSLSFSFKHATVHINIFVRLLLK